jgi:hypothetical protein
MSDYSIEVALQICMFASIATGSYVIGYLISYWLGIK